MTTFDRPFRNPGGQPEGSARALKARLATGVTHANVRSRLARTQLILAVQLIVLDVALMLICVLVAVIGRAQLPWFTSADDVRATAMGAAPAVIVVWTLVIAAFGGYAASATGNGSTEYQRVVLSGVVTAGLVGIGCYLTKYPLSRGFFFLLFLIGPSVLVLGRMLVRWGLGRLRMNGLLRLRVLVAGSLNHIDEVYEVLDRENWLGLDVVGAVAPPEISAKQTRLGVPVVGSTGDIAAVVGALDVDGVVFAEGSFPSAADFRKTVWELEEHHTQMIVVPGLTDVSSQRIQVRPVAGLPLVHVERPRRVAAARWMKRAFDLVGSIILLVLLSPLMLAAAVAVRSQDGGSALYRHTRVGRDGYMFECLKFRTMREGSDRRLGQVVHLNRCDGVLFKAHPDPRVTRVGRTLRRFSIDELPQLWNVIRGEMSLVGPRPPLESEVENYQTEVLRRLRIRPGMTGLWQVSGRSDLPWDDAVRLDLYYVDNWSMTQDFLILLRTVGAVLGGRGAY